MRVYIDTLGCKMNYVDSIRLEKALKSLGFEICQEISDKAEKIDFAIVNTCTVTDKADKKSLAKMRFLQKRADTVIMTGCGTRSDTINTNLKGVIIRRTIDDVIDYLRRFSSNIVDHVGCEALMMQNRTRAFVEIQTGCDTYCSYCIIPSVRGGSVFRSSYDIINEIIELENAGFQEAVLTGINIGAWGASNTNSPHESLFANLLDEILTATTMPRLRLSSLGPEFLNMDFFEVFADERICDHLHISMQSGSPNVLKKMNRGHDVEEILRVTELARKARRDVALTTDIIVGFPGETDRDFQHTLDLVKNIGLAKIHVFPFSARQGTSAALMNDQVADEIKKARVQELRKVASELRDQYLDNQKGKIHQVLFEQDESGLTSNYIRVRHAGACENDLLELMLDDKNILW